MSEKSILIAGAGVGGLTAALALHSRGLPVTVLERARELHPLGVGINLLSHAVRELRELGLGDTLDAVAVAPSSIHFCAEDGTLRFREPRGIAAGDAHPQLSVHRGLLQMMLLDAVQTRIGVDAVRTSAGVTGFVQSDDDVTVQTTSGAVTGAALIGADGIESTVRRLLHPGQDPLMWSGITMYRGACRMPAFLDGHTMAIIKGSNHIGLVAYPIGEDLVNWVIEVPDGTPGPLHASARWNATAEPADVVSHVGDWRIGWLDAAAMIAETERVFSYPMVDRDVLPHWGERRVTLLGDAAHPMYPVGANGGSQAIVDARVLADHLAARGIDGLRDYEDERRAETAEVVAANRRMHGRSAETDPHEIAQMATDYRSDTMRSTRS